MQVALHRLVVAEPRLRDDVLAVERRGGLGLGADGGELAVLDAARGERRHPLLHPPLDREVLDDEALDVERLAAVDARQPQVGAAVDPRVHALGRRVRERPGVRVREVARDRRRVARADAVPVRVARLRVGVRVDVRAVGRRPRLVQRRCQLLVPERRVSHTPSLAERRYYVQLMDKALQITDLVKRYPTGTEALRSVSLDIEAGEFFGLLGPNGAGKSTLIHCTTGLAQPTSGSIRVFGHDAIDNYGEARAGRRARAAGPQPRLVPHARGDARLPRRLLRDAARRSARERTAELLEAFSLSAQAQRPHAHAVGRHEAPADPRARAHAPARGCSSSTSRPRASTSSCASSCGSTSSASTPRARRSC